MRGLAVLMVVASHFLPRYLPNEGVSSVVHSLGIGGVVLFFNLSGFLVYKNITEMPGVAFLIRRAAKILPAYWFAIALHFILSMAGYYEPMSAEIYLTNLLLVQEIAGGVLLLGHFWTLAVEVKFYVIVAAFAPRLRKFFAAAIVLSVLAANIAIYLRTGRGSTLLSNTPIFFSGVLVYVAIKNGFRQSDLLSLTAYAVVVPASMIVFQQYNRFEYSLFVLVSLFALCWALLRPMKIGWLSYFGRISYSLYLLHPIVGFRAEAFLAQCGLPDYVATTFAILLSVTLADVSYRLIEVPGVRLGRKLGEFRAQAKPA